MTVTEIIQDAYRSREESWGSAQSALESWLRRQCEEALAGGDRMRLSVSAGRVKAADRAALKLSRKLEQDADLDLENWHDVERIIRDLVGTKILCKSTRDQRLIFDYLGSLNDVVGIERNNSKDYVSAPKPSGYRAMHLEYAVQVPGDEDPVPVELQIKTRLQDAWGELTHEDLYKPGGGLRPSPFHESVARTIADLLAIVDNLADELATEIESTLNATAKVEPSEDTITVMVRTTGPRYALAEDDSRRRGLIPAYAVREILKSTKYIDVDDHVRPGDRISVNVVDNDDGVFYIPVALPDRDALGV